MLGNRLEPRLQAVAEQIQGPVHADIGSDHALLPKYLLQTGRAKRVLVVEKNPTPFAHSRAALAGLNAEVRLGDGLEPLGVGEADSISLCGMGAKLMVTILSAHPAKLSSCLILQPNDSAQPLRQWALKAGFHLALEQMVQGFWRYSILTLNRAPGPDPAYSGLPLGAALRYGPLLLHARHPLLHQELLHQQQHWQRLMPSAPQAQAEVELVGEALECFQGNS